MITCVNNQDEICDQQDVISKTIITEKQFTMDSLSYNYLNKYKLEKVYEPNETPMLKIKNLPCVMNGNQLKKVTEIQYGGKKFYIEDVYVLSSSSSQQNSSKKDSKNDGSAYSSQNMQNSSKDSDKRISKKCCLFRKPKGNIKSEKRNTKNVAKNFCKAFVNYLKSQKKHNGQKDKLENCIHQVKSLVGHKKYYNNNVIWKIISSNVCKQSFKVFLEQHAKQWIQKSKMQYKQVHLEAIDIYLKLYEKMTFLEGDQEDEDEMQEQSSSK